MEQGERLDSTLMPQGQDVEHSTDDNEALDAAATRLLTAPSQPLSVAAAIEGHRAAREALNAACPAQDKVVLAAAGRDTSDEAMAPARAAWKAADEREVEAFEALLSCRPTDPAGLAQMLAYVAESPALGDLDDSTDALRNIAAAAEAVAASGPTMHANADVIALAEAALAAFIECRRMDDEFDAGRVPGDEQEAALAQANAALEKLSKLEVKTWSDMALKCLVLGAEEMWDLSFQSDPAEDYRTTRIGRHFEAMVLAGVPANLSAPAAPVVDPIFPMIAEGRRLLEISEALHARPKAETNAGETIAEADRTAALRALWDHNNGMILKTVPLTAAGCRELSRFAVEYFEKNGCAISDDEQAVTSLIARSPLSPPPSFEAVPDPVFSAIERYQTARDVGSAFSKRIEREGFEAMGGFDVVNEEDLKLSHEWSRLATEVLETVPTTEAGRLALAVFIEMWVDDHGNLDGSPQDGSETVFAEVYPALLNALRASVHPSLEPMVNALAPLPKPADPTGALDPHGAAELAESCDWAVKHSAWLNEATIAEGWSNDRLDAEMTKYNLVWDRAVSEPADTIQTLAAKVRMLKTSWLDNKGDEERDSLDKLILSVMEDVAALSSQPSDADPAPPTSANSSEPASSRNVGAGIPREGERLNFMDEVTVLSGHITDVTRFASIARIVRDDVLRQVDHRTVGETHSAYMLLRSQVNDLVFIIDQTADAAGAAEEAMMAAEDLFSRYFVVRDIQGNAA